ncbi:MAG: hypothetical protein ACFFE4_09875 [Candidatus Thorarchaeota archaeon]
MSENYSNLLNKLKKKYISEIEKLPEEALKYIVLNYRFEGSTLLFIIKFQMQLYNLTILIVNHNSNFEDKCKFLGSYLKGDNSAESLIDNIKTKIDENKELIDVSNELLEFLKKQIKKKREPQGKGKSLGHGTVTRASWYWFMFEGDPEDISIDDFFTDAFKEAKDRYQMKKELDEAVIRRRKSIEQINYLDYSDTKVQTFLEELKEDLEKIKNNLSDDLKNSFNKRSVIIENKALRKYGFTSKDSKACKLFKTIFPIDNLNIQSDLDSRRFSIYIRGLCEYLTEEVLQEYIVNPGKFDEFVIGKLNDFIKSYKTKILSYEIILPLNGIIADVEASSRELVIPFTENSGLSLFNDAILITKDTDIILGRSVHYRKDNNEEGINRAIAIFCKGNINFKFKESHGFLFDFDRSEPDSINISKEWIEIRNIFSSLILGNFKIGYSKQFYKFPWWVPKERFQYDFPTPEWLSDVMYFNPSQKMSIDRLKFLQIKHLIPESYRNITFPTPLRSQKVPFTNGDIVNGTGTFRIDQGRSNEMSYQEINLKIPSRNFQIIRNAFSIYSRRDNPINFYSSEFIMNKMIHLRLRERIEDAILDSSLIIESLLVSGESELAYQFRLHPSLLISKNISDFETNLTFFKDLYNLRSKIIHGDEKWTEAYRKFLNRNTRWNFSKSELDYNKIEFTRSEVLNLIFLKILIIINRINAIGLSIKEIQKPQNLIENLLFKKSDD